MIPTLRTKPKPNPHFYNTFFNQKKDGWEKVPQKQTLNFFYVTPQF